MLIFLVGAIGAYESIRDVYIQIRLLSHVELSLSCTCAGAPKLSRYLDTLLCHVQGQSDILGPLLQQLCVDPGMNDTDFEGACNHTNCTFRHTTAAAPKLPAQPAQPAQPVQAALVAGWWTYQPCHSYDYGGRRP